MELFSPAEFPKNIYYTVGDIELRCQENMKKTQNPTSDFRFSPDKESWF